MSRLSLLMPLVTVFTLLAGAPALSQTNDASRAMPSSEYENAPASQYRSPPESQYGDGGQRGGSGGMGIEDARGAAEEAVTDARRNAEGGDAAYNAALDAARSTGVDEATASDIATRAVASTPGDEDGNSEDDDASRSQYGEDGQPSESTGPVVIQEARRAANEAVRDARGDAEDGEAAYDAALNAARSAGAQGETATSIAEQAVASAPPAETGSAAPDDSAAASSSPAGIEQGQPDPGGAASNSRTENESGASTSAESTIGATSSEQSEATTQKDAAETSPTNETVMETLTAANGIPLLVAAGIVLATGGFLAFRSARR